MNMVDLVLHIAPISVAQDPCDDVGKSSSRTNFKTSIEKEEFNEEFIQGLSRWQTVLATLPFPSSLIAPGIKNTESLRRSMWPNVNPPQEAQRKYDIACHSCRRYVALSVAGSRSYKH